MFAHIQRLDEMRLNAELGELQKNIFGNAIVQNAFAFDHVVFFGVKGGGVVFEMLHKRAGFGALIEHFGLALIYAAAL